MGTARGITTGGLLALQAGATKEEVKRKYKQMALEKYEFLLSSSPGAVSVSLAVVD